MRTTVTLPDELVDALEFTPHLAVVDIALDGAQRRGEGQRERNDLGGHHGARL